jgi:hypothetical protein
MPADHGDKPALRPPEAEEIEFEVMDDGAPAESPSGGSMADFAEQMQMAPGMLVEAFRAMLKEKLRRWFVRSLIWGGVLGFLATEHTWAKWAFGIWAFVASTHLVFLLCGWHVSGKQGAKLAKMFGGTMRPPGQ